MYKPGLMLFAVLFAGSAVADVPVFRDQLLSIDEVLVVTESGARYFTDIKLQANADGRFELVEAQRQVLAHVDEVLVEVQQAQPVQVSVEVAGYLPTRCYELEKAAVIRDGSTFTIVLAQRALQTFAVCAQIIEPFNLAVPLNTQGLPPGHYTVIVNDKQSGFDLTENDQAIP